MNIFNVNKNDISHKTNKPIVYSGDMFGIKNGATGKGIEIAIVGTGLPSYQGFTTLHDFDVMIDGTTTDSPYDDVGCGTALAGFVASNGSCGIYGLAKDTKILSLKSFTKKRKINPSIIVASLLWGIIKDVNIIVMPFEIDIEYQPILSVVKKTFDRKIIILSVNSPLYENCNEIFPVIPCPKKDKYGIDLQGHKVFITLPIKKQITAYGDKSFVSVNRQIASLGLAAGVMSLLLEKNKKIV